MDELIPVILSALFGVIVYRKATGRLRTVLGACAVLTSGAAATVFSGEYHDSWLYFFADLGLAAIGLATGFALAYFLSPSRPRKRASLTGSSEFMPTRAKLTR